MKAIEMVWVQLKRHMSTINMTSKEDFVNNIRLFWSTYMTKLQCATYTNYVYKVVSVCILMKGQGTGSITNKIFKEPSHGESITLRFSKFCCGLQIMTTSVRDLGLKDSKNNITRPQTADQ